MLCAWLGTGAQCSSRGHMNTATALTFAAVVLGGCTATSESTTPLRAVGTSATSNSTPPIVTAAGTSPISSDKQAAFCQDQVAFRYSTEPQYVTARGRVVAADGSTTIDVTVDNENKGVKTFKCRLDARNRFIDVIAATSDGVL